MFDIVFNNKSLRNDLDVSIVKRPSSCYGSKNVEKVEVAGMNGDLYLDLGGNKDITISVECNFVSCNCRERFRLIRSWLNNVTDNRLFFSDDTNWFYKVVYVSISDMQVIYRRKGYFTIEFTCRPHQYNLDGNMFKTIENGEILFNEYDTTKPNIKIIGNGEVTININNTICKAKVNGELYIDSELEVAYQNNSEYGNIIDGEYPTLVNGTNSISWNGNVEKFEIQTNWRCI